MQCMAVWMQTCHAAKSKLHIFKEPPRGLNTCFFQHLGSKVCTCHMLPDAACSTSHATLLTSFCNPQLLIYQPPLTSTPQKPQCGQNGALLANFMRFLGMLHTTPSTCKVQALNPLPCCSHPIHTLQNRPGHHTRSASATASSYSHARSHPRSHDSSLPIPSMPRGGPKTARAIRMTQPRSKSLQAQLPTTSC